MDQLRTNWKKIDEASGYKNGGCVKRMEKGGDVDGPGTGTSDSVPAMLSDGEYVLPADTVDAVGKATLDKLKAATHTPVNTPKMRGMVKMLADGGEIGQSGYRDLSKYLNPSRYSDAARNKALNLGVYSRPTQRGRTWRGFQQAARSEQSWVLRDIARHTD